MTAGSLSRWILWGDSTSLETNISGTDSWGESGKNAYKRFADSFENLSAPTCSRKSPAFWL
jgi:hypothetical protein